MVNVVDFLVDSGALVQVEAGWELRLETENIEMGVPENIRQMIEHQIDRLDPEDQRILEAASVASAEFPASPLAAALDAEVIHIEERCEALAHRHQLLEAIQNVDSPEASPPGRYDFVHSLYRSVLYDRISPGRRAHLHARVDLHEEARYGDRAGEIAVELVDLLTLQYDWFTEGFDTRDLREAKELLELLRTHS